MAGSMYGKLFQIATWGESHGKGLGVVIDGCPAGLALHEEDIQKDLDRRKPGTSEFTTRRDEKDLVRIMSGVFDGKTTGTPISLVILNEDQRSGDYDSLAGLYRPGHADYTYDMKYGFRDHRGGGRASARETAARVAAGAVARKILQELGVTIMGYTISVGGISIDRNRFAPEERFTNPLVMPDQAAYEQAAALLRETAAREDSLGGVVECLVSNLPPGIGEPVFAKLDAALGQAIFSIGAVKAVEFGAGFQVAGMKGSENNDSFYYENGVKKRTNNAGGVLGGISDGSELIIRAAFKPTPSVAQAQKTVNQKNENTEVNIRGRHDPTVVARAVIVVEAMTAITLVDLMMQNMLSGMDGFRMFYQEKR